MAYNRGSGKKQNSPLKIATGMWAGSGKVIYRATTDFTNIRNALKEAVAETKVEGKVQVLIIESRGKTDVMIAFAPVELRDKDDYDDDSGPTPPSKRRHNSPRKATEFAAPSNSRPPVSKWDDDDEDEDGDVCND